MADTDPFGNDMTIKLFMKLGLIKQCRPRSTLLANLSQYVSQHTSLGTSVSALFSEKTEGQDMCCEALVGETGLFGNDRMMKICFYES